MVNKHSPNLQDWTKIKSQNIITSHNVFELTI